MWPSKPEWLSKTLIVNVLSLVAAIIGVLLGSELIKDYPAVAGIATAVLAAVNIVLRFFTAQPLNSMRDHFLRRLR